MLRQKWWFPGGCDALRLVYLAVDRLGNSRNTHDRLRTVRLIDLSGSASERSRMHGKAAADRLRRGAKMYAKSLLRSGVDWAEVERLAEALVPSIEKFDPTYIEEMRGIAEGANEPVRRRGADERGTEMVAAARQEQEPGKQVPAGCTAAPGSAEASADGMLLHGETWDWRAGAPRPAWCCASIATTAPTS